MKTFLLIIFIIFAIPLAVFAIQNNNSKAAVNGGYMNKKILIAYYSWGGNTKSAAEKIKTQTGGDLFEIKPAVDYPKDYNTVVNQAKKEKEQNIKPKLKDNGNIENYDIIFIGTPVWWYTMASPVKTFLAENNFKGKTVVPFCTHGGGGASSTYTDMQKLAPDAEFLEGFTSYENSASNEDIKKWLSGLNI